MKRIWVFQGSLLGALVVSMSGCATESVIADQAEAAGVWDFLDDRYPTFDGRSMVETLPQPAQMEARLYEVMPYPRYPRYFRRHWW